jgi:hypothetical protein
MFYASQNIVYKRVARIHLPNRELFRKNYGRIRKTPLDIGVLLKPGTGRYARRSGVVLSRHRSFRADSSAFGQQDRKQPSKKNSVTTSSRPLMHDRRSCLPRSGLVHRLLASSIMCQTPPRPRRVKPTESILFYAFGRIVTCIPVCG